MGARGRRSGAASSTPVVEVEFSRRPTPPDDLNEQEAAIWTAVVNSEPVDFFGTAALRNLLADYCRHRASADMLSKLIGEFQPEWMDHPLGAKRYGNLTRMRDRETRAAADKATKLRLTNQSRYTPQAAATASRNVAKGRKPWEV